MKRSGHIMLKLRSGHETRAPAHLDVLEGARRSIGSVDGYGAVDRTLSNHTSAIRCSRFFHGAEHLGQPGSRTVTYSDLEREIGLERIVSIELADPEARDAIVSSLRDLSPVEWVMAEPMATTPMGSNSEAHQFVSDAFVRVGAAAALKIEPGARHVAVAVIDTGIALEHHEFSGRLRQGYDAVDLGIGRIGPDVSLVGDSRGRDFCARDETGHGTHVAGIVGARGHSMQPGVAGASPIIPVRALAAAREGADGPVFGVGGISDIDAAIKVAVDLGAKVLNMSFGTSSDDVDPDAAAPHSDVLQYALARGCIPVAAMGNSGLAEDYYPAALPGCIAVGSVDHNNERSVFSTQGDHVALCAPGEGVVSAGLNGYRASTGTSHAAPFVAGAAALLAARAERNGQTLNAYTARDVLCQSADRTNPHNPDTGWGTLNIPAALSKFDEMNSQQRSTSYA